MADHPVVVVGGGVAGSAAASALAAGGAPVVLLDADPHQPYDRPPLSKEVAVGAEDGAADALHPPGWWEAQGVDLRVGTRVTGVDPADRIVHLASGETVPWSWLVLATGGRARRLGCPGADLAGVHTVTDLGGAEATAAALADLGHPVRDVVVIGAGFLGCEVAAAVVRTGRAVTVLEAGPQPLVGAVGSAVADWLLGVHRAEGVDLRVGVAVEALEGDGRVTAVRVADGTVVPADLVVVAIGITLDLSLAEGAGCTLDRGVVVDHHLRTSVEGVLAVGDVARYPCPWAGTDAAGEPVGYRCEHDAVAIGHGAAAARTVLAARAGAASEPYADLPTWWTQQYDLVVNGVGCPETADAVVLRGSQADADFVAAYFRDDLMVGGVACGQRRELRSLRRVLARRAVVRTADLADPTTSFRDLDQATATTRP